MLKMVNLEGFQKPELCSQTVLPDKSVLIGQQLMEKDKIQKFKCDILGDFQTVCECVLKELFWTGVVCYVYFYFGAKILKRLLGSLGKRRLLSYCCMITFQKEQ